MPTVEELGRVYKQHYPDYSGYSDRELGLAMKKEEPDRYAAYTDAPPAQAAAGPSASRPPESRLQRLQTDFRLGMREGKSDFEHTYGRAATLTHIPALQGYGKTLEEYSQQAAVKPEELKGRESTLDLVAQGVGQLPWQVAKYAPAIPAGWYAPLVAGGIAGVGASDKGWKEAAKTGAETAATWAVMGAAGKIPKTIPRIAATAAAQGIPTALSGGTPQQTAAATVLGGALGIQTIKPADAARAAKGGWDAVDVFKNDIRKHLLTTFFPQGLSAEADAAADAVVNRAAERHVVAVRANFAMEAARKEFGKMSPDEIREFYKSVQAKPVTDPATGQKMRPPLPGKFAFAQITTDVSDAIRDEVRSLKTGRLQEYYVNYWTQLWKDPKMAEGFYRNLIGGKRPLEGTKARFKPKKYPTIEDGIAAGLEPRFDNPVDTVNFAVADLNRFILATEVKNELRPMSAKFPDGRGIIKPLREGVSMPDGYGYIGDKAFDIYKPRKPPAPGKKPEPRELWGRFVAPLPVTTVFNNYLSKGLGDLALYKGARGYANFVLRAQYALSGFHAGMTSTNAVMSQFATGVERIVDGMTHPLKRPGQIAKGALDIAASPTAWFTNILEGRDLRRAIRDPKYAAAHPVMQKMVDQFILGGGRIETDPVYRTDFWGNMRQAFRKNQNIWGLMQLPAALIDGLAKPIMEHYVPLQKLGAFTKMMEFELERRPAMSEIQARVVAQDVWNSVENRFGLLTRDNLFWNKYASDIGHVLFRALTYQIGTARELGGAALDVATMAKKLARGNTEGLVTHKMAYAVAMPAVVFALGSVGYYMLHGKGPDNLKDAFMIPTGHKDNTGHDERVAVPSYLNDAFNFAYSPGQTIRNKMGPDVELGLRMMRNADWHNVEIWNEKDSMVQMLGKQFGFVAGQLEPISVNTQLGREKGPETPQWQKNMAYIGVKPVQSHFKKSAAELHAERISEREHPEGVITREQADRRELIQNINAIARANMRGAKINAVPIIEQGLRDGIISREDIKKDGEALAVNPSPLARIFKTLSLEDAVDIWLEAEPVDKVRLSLILATKIHNEADKYNTLPGLKQKRFVEELQRLKAQAVKENLGQELQQLRQEADKDRVANAGQR